MVAFLLKAPQDVLSLIAKCSNDLTYFTKSLAKKLVDWLVKNKKIKSLAKKTNGRWNKTKKTLKSRVFFTS